MGEAVKGSLKVFEKFICFEKPAPPQSLRSKIWKNWTIFLQTKQSSNSSGGRQKRKRWAELNFIPVNFLIWKENLGDPDDASNAEIADESLKHEERISCPVQLLISSFG